MLTPTEAAALDDDQRRALHAALALQRKSWEQGVLGHALLDLGLTRAARLVGRDAVQLQLPDGRLAQDTDTNVNCAASGEAVLAAGDDDAAARQVRWLLHDAPRAADGTLFHLAGPRQVWVDTVYMVVPFLVRAGHPADAAAQLDGHRRRLFHAGAGLYGHLHDEDGPGRDAHWGTGNGWVVAGLARALRHGGDPAWAEHATTVLDACLRHRTTSGLFHDVLDDPETFEETNLVQMLAYGIFTGLADGWLPERYAATGHELLGTARAHLDEDGLVVPVCAAPHFDRPGHSAEAQAFFLLATASERAGRP